MTTVHPRPSASSTNLMRKVPLVIALFWVVKIMTTAVGESISDYLVKTINPEVAVGLGAMGLIVALAMQFRARKYIAWVYWLTVVMVAIFGTMAADVTHVALGVPYAVSSATFFVALMVIFALWYRVEHTLSIHSIFTRRREVFYWATVLATFALGTAAGDFAAYSMHLGFFVAALVFAVAITVPAVAFFWFGLNEVAAFWSAYIVTRPLGASLADLFGKPTSGGGLGYGDAAVSLVLVIIIILLVGYLQVSRADVESGRAGKSA